MSVRPSAATARHRRWIMLAVLALGFAAMTLNWFAMPTAFAGIGTDLHAGLPDLALLISAFVIGYGVMHIPAGFLAARIGLRLTMTGGLVIEGVVTAGSGLAPSYPILLALRVVCGLAASVYAGIGIASASVWFRGREHALALGVVCASFSLGVTVALSVWVQVVAATTWRGSLGVAGAVAIGVGLLIAAVYRVPDGADRLRGAPLNADAVRRTFGSPLLWRYALAFFGGYGAYFAASQLIRVYATQERGLSGAAVTWAALLIGLAGVPGSIIAGWLSAGSRRPYMIGFLLLEALGLILVPVSGGWLWLPALIVGFGFNGCFAVCQTVAGEDPRVSVEHIGTALGLMLTIAAIGGFAVPWLFGFIAPAAGYHAAWSFLAAVTVAFAFMTPATSKISYLKAEGPLPVRQHSKES
jgi:MFS transporter, ACS family, D-galactonate transporter